MMRSRVAVQVTPCARKKIVGIVEQLALTRWRIVGSNTGTIAKKFEPKIATVRSVSGYLDWKHYDM